MIKQTLQNELFSAVKTGFPEITIKPQILETDARFGDYASNIALIIAKQKGLEPEDVARQITEKIDQKLFEITVAGQGFINFKLKPIFYQQVLTEILSQKEKYGQSDLLKDQKVNIEFISANPTGPLTLGNGRGGYCGDCLARVFALLGADVNREYYINDRGVQIEALGHSVLKDDQAVYKGAYIDEIAPHIKTTDPLEAGKTAAAYILENYIQKTIKKMGITFDNWFSENVLHQKNSVEHVLGLLSKSDLTYKKEGALWLKTTLFGDDKDRVLITSDGNYTYFSSDIAYHLDKISRGYNILIDFWGADHHGYIGRMQAAIDILKTKTDWSGELTVLIAQLVRLMSKGQEVKMSKRAGTYVTLDELMDEVGPDVARFFFLERSLNTHMDFDLDLAKEKSDKNPVYYVQYAHARIFSILSKTEQIENADLTFLNDLAEVELIKKIAKFPEILFEIATNYQVHKLANYSLELANTFHNFYEKCPVINAPQDVKNARISLLIATKQTLSNVLATMGISAPEKM